MNNIMLFGGGMLRSAADRRYIQRNKAVIYGVRWDYVNDVMVKGIIIGGVFIETDYNNFPIQEQMVRGLLTSAGEFMLLDASDSSQLASGGAATLDGSVGQVMVRIPKFYTLCLKDGDYRYVLISDSSFSFLGNDAWIPPAFGSDNYRYISAFQGVAATDTVDADLISAVKDTSAYTTNLYPNPFSNRTRAQFRAQQQSGFFQFSWGLYEIVWMLFLTEYKTWNSQAVLPGYTEASSYSYSYARKAGRTLSLGNASGSVLVDLAGDDSDLSGIVAVDKYVANSYRGIENFFGNAYQFIDGINIDNTTGDCHVYVCHTPDDFADDTGTNYIDTGHAPAFGDAGDYIKDMAFVGEAVTFYPAELGGTSSTYIPDYHSNSAGGWRVLFASGFLSYGAGAGLGRMNAFSASSYYASLTSTRSAA
jgi:hypothetical protein